MESIIITNLFIGNVSSYASNIINISGKVKYLKMEFIKL